MCTKLSDLFSVSGISNRTSLLVMIVLLVACTPDQTPMFTNTPQQPTKIITPTSTITPSNTPTSVPTNTPTPEPSPTPEAALPTETLPTPTGLSAEGQAAYENIAHVLLTTNELDAVCGFEEEGWVFVVDEPGLGATCRTFERPDTFIHHKFFSCVIQVVDGFNLETDDLGLYEVQQTHESAYEFEYPHQVYAYFAEPLGRLGIDHIVQIEDFVYIAGLELVTPLGTPFESMFDEYADQVLYEALEIMVTRAEANPPERLDFPPGASSRAGNQFTPFLVNPADMDDGWEMMEADEIYENDGTCRSLYYKGSPPPAIFNCIFNADFYSLDEARGFYADRDYVDVTQVSRYSYEDPFFVFLDYTGDSDDSYPRYSITLEKDGVLVSVDLVNPFLSSGTSLKKSFTPEIDDLINLVLQMNLSALTGYQTIPAPTPTPIPSQSNPIHELAVIYASTNFDPTISGVDWAYIHKDNYGSEGVCLTYYSPDDDDEENEAAMLLCVNTASEDYDPAATVESFTQDWTMLKSQLDYGQLGVVKLAGTESTLTGGTSYFAWLPIENDSISIQVNLNEEIDTSLQEYYDSNLFELFDHAYRKALTDANIPIP